MNEILLMCPKCCKGMLINRDDLHPKKAEIEVQDCPECWRGDFDIPRYFDENFNEISPSVYEHLWVQGG